LIVWETLIIETKSKGYKTNRLARRKFLKTAAAAGCITATNLAFGRSSRSDKAEAFRLVAETDRKRILEAAANYVSQTPLTKLRRFPPRAAQVGCMIFIPKQTTSGQIRTTQMGGTSTAMGQSNPESIAR
jgi:hypothetical protein